MKKAKDFRDQSLEELEATLRDMRKTQFDLINQRTQDKKLEKPHLIRQTKKEIARLLTVISEKQLTAQSLE